MFTGLVAAVGEVRSIQRKGRSVRLQVRTPFRGIREGESIALSGVCLTALSPSRTGRLVVEASAETLRRSTLGGLRPGAPVNLERALRPLDRLGGHIVQGHVDGVGRLLRIEREGDARRLEFEVPPPLRRFVVEKGSITVEGVSLTVGERTAKGIALYLIPHTLAKTTLGGLRAGDPVNLEIDILAKVVESLLMTRRATARAPRRRRGG